MPTFDVSGFRMFYETRGEGDPLLLLHGGMGIGSDWRSVFSSDPAGYRVTSPIFAGTAGRGCPTPVSRSASARLM